MKRLPHVLLILGGILLSHATLKGQGWTGNTSGSTEIVRAVDMAGSGGNPNLRVTIGLASPTVPTAQLHTTGTVRFAGIAQDNAFTRVMVQNATGDVRWRDAGTIGPTNAWLLTGNANAAAPNNILGTLVNSPVRFFTNSANRATLTDAGLFVHPNNTNTALFGFFADGTNLGAYGKIRTQLLGNNNGTDWVGIPVATMDNINDNNLGTTGIVENRHGDSYFRGYWGVVVDKYGGGASFTPGLSDNTYTNGNDVFPEPGCFGIRTRTTATNFRTDLIVRRNGFVGIATLNPTSALDVNGTVTGLQGVFGSDQRFKTNIQPIDDPMNIIRKMNGYTYDFARDKYPELHFPENPSAGFLAQELQKVFPVSVVTRNDGFLGVNYNSLLPVIVEAMKAQDKKVQELERLLEEATQKLQELTEAVERNNTSNATGAAAPALYQNVPNPFNQTTLIRYKLTAEHSNASIQIFDLNGRLVKKIANLNTSEGEVTLTAKELEPGMYIYALISNGTPIATRKMIIE